MHIKPALVTSKDSRPAMGGNLLSESVLLHADGQFVVVVVAIHAVPTDGVTAVAQVKRILTHGASAVLVVDDGLGIA